MNTKAIRNLQEAYSDVYAPQELTEDQIWEEVENWVNALLEEGYDLSDYTWEEMYEEWERIIVEQDTDSMADRTRRAVNHQRGGTHGDDDALKKAAEGLGGSMQKLRKQGQRGAYQGA